LSNPACENGRTIMTTSIATNEQMELGLGLAGLKISPAQHPNKIARANWWFTKMRETVANAMDWSAPAEPRPEQIWIRETTREVKV